MPATPWLTIVIAMLDRLAVEVGEEGDDVLGEQAGVVGVAGEDLGREADARVGRDRDLPEVGGLRHSSLSLRSSAPEAAAGGSSSLAEGISGIS